MHVQAYVCYVVEQGTRYREPAKDLGIEGGAEAMVKENDQMADDWMQMMACVQAQPVRGVLAEARVRFDAGLSALGGASWAAAVAASEVAEQQERQAKRRREAAAPGERSREYARSRAERLERERRGRLATLYRRQRPGCRVVLRERPRQAPERRWAVVARDEVTHCQLG